MNEEYRREAAYGASLVTFLRTMGDGEKSQHVASRINGTGDWLVTNVTTSVTSEMSPAGFFIVLKTAEIDLVTW